MKKRTKVAVAVATIAVLASAACGGNDAPEESAKTTVGGPATPLSATVSDYKVVFGEASVAAGRLRITVKNDGQVQHELVAFRTDLAEDQLPMGKGEVNEKGPGITHIDPEAEDIAPGSSKSATLDLKAGRYVFICNVPGHYALGMHTVLTVN